MLRLDEAMAGSAFTVAALPMESPVKSPSYVRLIGRSVVDEDQDACAGA
jgi:hypothetical protein